MIDDDEVADPFWLLEAAKAFERNPKTAVVSGLVLPAEIETKPQEWFERFGGFAKGRGFRADYFDPSEGLQQSPLFPLPSFGLGGNMIIRRKALSTINNFEETLGAGTRTMGAEDTYAFTRLLLNGLAVAYEPGVLTWHYHRRDYVSLQRQFFGYGRGLSAFYACLLREDPRTVWPLMR